MRRLWRAVKFALGVLAWVVIYLAVLAIGMMAGVVLRVWTGGSD